MAVISSAQFEACRYRRRNYFLNRPMKGGGWADWNQIHLAKRDVLRFRGMFHETIELSCSDDKVKQLSGEMLHINDETYSERLRKSSAYQAEVMASVREQEGRVGVGNLIWSFVREFLVKYIAKRGIKDGIPGLIWAFHAAGAAFRARALVWDEQNRIAREDLEKSLNERWHQDGGAS